ncbi:ubiquitin specific protease 16-like protein [Camelus ferus]|nr:ubiquitin specific protease 16-like protein [Camelus ferus]
MRVKEPSGALPEKAKRSKRPPVPHDEDSSDDIADAFSRIIKLYEEKCETGEKNKGRKGSSVTSVKGITNLGNTCFFNAVIQNLAQSYILTELMNEVKEHGTKLKIVPSSDSHLEVGTTCRKENPPGKRSQHHDALFFFLARRIQAGILKAFNNPTTKTADDETRKKVKAYGREGVKMNFIDRIFIGELTSTVMCEECANISMVKDPFIDISLPIIEERNQLIHGRKCTRELPSGEDKAVIIHQENENLELNGDSPLFASIMNTESTLTDSPTDGSEKEASLSESSVDADSEPSESESASKQALLLRSSSGYSVHANGHLHRPSESEPLTKESDSGDDRVAEAISELHLRSTFTSMELLMGNNKLLCENCTEKKQKYQKETSSADQPWMPPTPGPMDIVPPSEDSNSQDSGEFAPDNRHIFNQNNHNFGGPPDNFAVGPVNQFDYQVDFILLIGNQDLQDLRHLPRIEEKGHHHSGIDSVHLLHFL